MSKEQKRRADDEELATMNQAAEELTPSTTVVPTEERIEFKSWFTAALQKSKKLQAHHYTVILAFAQLHQLSEHEAAAKYDELLKKFGY